MELIAALLHQPRVLFSTNRPSASTWFRRKSSGNFSATTRRPETTILLTSHYMTDIQELCRRIIIIDKGRIFFDGRLAEVLDRFADFKIVSISWLTGARFPQVDLKRYGEVLQQTSNRIQLKVKRDQVIAACKQLLDELPVNDIDIQEVPIEEVIRQIFAR